MSEISISGKLDEYVFFQVAIVRSSGIYGAIDLPERASITVIA